jgi:hypothetical protein
MKRRFALLILIALTVVSAAVAADQATGAERDSQSLVSPLPEKYLESVTTEIRARMHGVKVLAGVATDVEFAIPADGGEPEQIYISTPANTDWDEYVKKTLKQCRFPAFSFKDADVMKITARISYFPDSKEVQPAIRFGEVKLDKNIPTWRIGGVMFSSAIAICGAVCLVVQTLIIIIGLFGLRKMFCVPAKTAAKTDT